ncbi:pyrroloquinoline quinone biosynthesis protein PqqB [Granulosicoccus sp. 3-233]|uniref:pyrroloquinoline quinone biosynthesis protein PqqB n=1 Tax=Granulosicoccus sp. 3-233 TaxID=3417969 RepID=UPI003D34E78E
MFIRILGSAAGGGFPQWNCNCPMCTGVRTGSINARVRTQSSIAVSHDRCDWVLFNASPDILTQIQQCGVLQPARQLRDTGIQSIVLMDAQIDHTTGLLMLREHRQALSIWCTAAVREDLSEGNPLFRVLDHYSGIDWHELTTDGNVCQIPGAASVTFTALSLTSNAPPYSPHRDKPVDGDTIGMMMSDTVSGRSVFYAPGLGEMETHVWEAMQSADVVLIDGTMWTDDEMIQRGASNKTARSMGHLPQSGSGGMLEWLDKLPESTRKILIHINNTNPILDEDSEERSILDDHGVEVAHDGLELEI